MPDTKLVIHVRIKVGEIGNYEIRLAKSRYDVSRYCPTSLYVVCPQCFITTLAEHRNNVVEDCSEMRVIF